MKKVKFLAVAAVLFGCTVFAQTAQAQAQTNTYYGYGIGHANPTNTDVADLVAIVTNIVPVQTILEIPTHNVNNVVANPFHDFYTAYYEGYMGLFLEWWDGRVFKTEQEAIESRRETLARYGLDSDWNVLLIKNFTMNDRGDGTRFYDWSKGHAPAGTGETGSSSSSKSSSSSSSKPAEPPYAYDRRTGKKHYVSTPAEAKALQDKFNREYVEEKNRALILRNASPQARAAVQQSYAVRQQAQSIVDAGTQLGNQLAAAIHESNVESERNKARNAVEKINKESQTNIDNWTKQYNDALKQIENDKAEGYLTIARFFDGTYGGYYQFARLNSTYNSNGYNSYWEMYDKDEEERFIERDYDIACVNYAEHFRRTNDPATAYRLGELLVGKQRTYWYTSCIAACKTVEEADEYLAKIGDKYSGTAADKWYSGLSGEGTAQEKLNAFKSKKAIAVVKEIIDNMVFVEANVVSKMLVTVTDDNKHVKRIIPSFYICKYEITKEQFDKIMGKIRKNDDTDKHPVWREWKDVCEFIEVLNRNTGLRFRLPAVDEWMHAAKGGNQSKKYKYSGSNEYYDVAKGTQDKYNAGDYKPNELGIYNMSGCFYGMYEWCAQQRIWSRKKYYKYTPKEFLWKNYEFKDAGDTDYGTIRLVLDVQETK
jgi:hypothetical protein